MRASKPACDWMRSSPWHISGSRRLAGKHCTIQGNIPRPGSRPSRFANSRNFMPFDTHASNAAGRRERSFVSAVHRPWIGTPPTSSTSPPAGSSRVPGGTSKLSITSLAGGRAPSVQTKIETTSMRYGMPSREGPFHHLKSGVKTVAPFRNAVTLLSRSIRLARQSRRLSLPGNVASPCLRAVR